MSKAELGFGENFMPDLSLTCAICKGECDESMIFESLKVWRDPVARSGPENMATDEWLFRQGGEEPLLRLYEWAGDWVSLGYFQSLSEARVIFGGDLKYVRRWTGGGIVDHRADSTYTLVIPRSEELAGSRGSESYCAIHKAVAACLQGGGQACDLATEDSKSDSKACFERPVQWDLLATGGGKLAGAGQRRGREGILHQGSVAAPMEILAGLAACLAGEFEEVEFFNMSGLDELVRRYEQDEWLMRVP
jgi:lipoate-protein ligase A